jgi:hypothetical protein
MIILTTAFIWSCQKDELPELASNESLKSALSGTWTVLNRRKADANSGKDLKWSDTTKTVASGKTTILIKKRFWSLTNVVSQGSSD